MTGTATKPKQSVRQQSRIISNVVKEELPIPNEARLSISVSTKSGNPDILKNLDESKNAVQDTKPNKNDNKPKDEGIKVIDESRDIDKKKDVSLEEEKQNSLGNDVETVIEKQKRIEEDNKRKKEVIRKALEDR